MTEVTTTDLKIPTAVPAPVRRNPWPYAIIGWFILFITGMATWTVVAVRQDMDLVRPDYYEQEIRYQQQIDRLNRTSAVRAEVSIVHDAAGRTLSLRLPAAHASGSVEGWIQFYRPSNARLDFTRPLSLDAQGTQRIDTGSLASGLWKVQVQWKVGGHEYYHEQPLVL